MHREATRKARTARDTLHSGPSPIISSGLQSGPSLSSKSGDLSVTALYTCQTWVWGGLPYAKLFAHPAAKRVFDATNAALALSRVFRRDFAPLRQSLIHRHALIDALVKRAAPGQVLELAAGLSRRGATFSENPAISYTEVDLPHVVKRKRELLERTAEGRAVLARPNFRLVEADLEQAELSPWVDPGRPAFVIAEGLMMYLQPPAQRRIWTQARALAERATDVSFAFDLVPTSEQPAPGAVGRALEAAMKAFTRGRAFERDGRTRQEIAAELRAIGFSDVELLEPAVLARAWDLPFPDARTQQLLFFARVPSRGPAQPD
jgi:O-methyltransferase involved in polyketide biosynthesis